MPLRRFAIERDIPGVGGLDRDEISGAAAQSNSALAELAPKLQWVESYVADDKTFWACPAEDEGAIRRDAELSGFPASKDHANTPGDRPMTERAAETA